MDFDTLITETIKKVLEGGAAVGGHRIPQAKIQPLINAFTQQALAGLQYRSVKPVGSTGKKKDSGDVDLGLDTTLSLEKIAAHIKSKGFMVVINKGLGELSVLFPFDGLKAQVDLMVGPESWTQTQYYGPSDTESKYKGVYVRGIANAIIQVIGGHSTSPARGFFRKDDPEKKYNQDWDQMAKVISAKSTEPWAAQDFTQPFEKIWEKAQRSFKPEELAKIKEYFLGFMKTTKQAIPDELGEGMAYDKGWQKNLSGQTAGGTAQGVGGARNRGKVPKGMVPDSLRNRAPAPGNEDEGFKTQDPSDIYEAVSSQSFEKLKALAKKIGVSIEEKTSADFDAGGLAAFNPVRNAVKIAMDGKEPDRSFAFAHELGHAMDLNTDDKRKKSRAVIYAVRSMAASKEDGQYYGEMEQRAWALGEKILSQVGLQPDERWQARKNKSLAIQRKYIQDVLRLSGEKNLQRMGEAVDDEAARLASEYTRIHNTASKEFTKAFNAIGAKMWSADNAHQLKQKNTDFIADQIRSNGIEFAKSVYGPSCVPFPLTVMDSYPEARKHTASLEKVLDAIKKKYDAEWDSVINSSSGLNEAVDPGELQKGIPHLDDLKPAEFLAFLKKYADEPLRLEISEKVDGSARISFGKGAGHIWTQSKNGTRKATSNQYPDTPMYKALKMAHKALESKADPIMSAWPAGVQFMVAEVLYTRIPNSIEYGPNVLMIHGVEGQAGPLDDVKAKQAAQAIIAPAGGQLSDGAETWKFEYKRNVSPKDVAVDVRKEYDTLGQLYQDLIKKPRDKNLSAEFKKIQKQVKERLIKMLRSQKSAYGPEGGDVEGLVFRDLDSGQMVKLVDKDFFTTLNSFLWHHRKMLDAGAKVGGEWKKGVMQGFREVVADQVLGDKTAASTMLVKNLTQLGQGIQGKTPEQRADKTLAKYITQNKLMTGDFARSFQRSLMGAFQDLGKLKAEWEEFKSKPQSIDIDGKKRQFPPEHIGRTEEAFQSAEAALQGIKAGMQAAHNIKHPLTQKVALMKLFMGHKFDKLVTALGGGSEEETVEEGVGSWARGIAAGAMLGVAGQSDSDRTEPPPPPEISHHEESISSMIKSASQETGVSEELIAAIMTVESHGNPDAVSKKGARGLMQLMPATAKSMGVSNIMDPRENLLGGARYLAKLLKAFNGNVDWAIAAYNMGPNALHRAESGKRPKETMNYLKKVKKLLANKSVKTEGLFNSNKSDKDVYGDAGLGSKKPMPSDAFHSDPDIDAFRRGIRDDITATVNNYRTRLEKRLGKPIGKAIGVGSAATVFDLGDRVLKVTSDESDANACMHVMGKNLKHVVKVFDVFQMPRDDGSRFFAVVAEKLKPLDADEKQLIKPAMGLLNMVSGHPWSYIEDKMKQDPTGLMSFLKYYDVKDRQQMMDAVQAFRLNDMLDELSTFEYSSGDFHDENLMKRADGTVVLSDMGYSSSSAGRVSNTLEKKMVEQGPVGVGPTALDGKKIEEPGMDDAAKVNVVEGMIFEQLRVLLEAQQGTIGVTIGRFQPFHAGHAAIIRQLAQKYSSVVVFIAGQKIDAKNPFSHETRLKMMKASLPDVWSKVKVFPATIQGKGTGYIPSLIANASATGEAEIPMDGSVDVLVGEDRLKDQQTQAKHNEAHKGEQGYYPGMINVTALPGVKNDDDAGRISGTRVREALAKNDQHSVMKMLDPHLANGPEFAVVYKELRDQMKKTGAANEFITRTINTVISELGMGGNETGPGATRGGGTSGWSRAILARDMTGEEIYQQMNKSPSTRMLQMANHGTPNDHLPGQDSLDQRIEDEQDASKPTDLGELVVKSLQKMVETTRQETEREKKGLGVAQNREINTSFEDKWNSWSIDMTDEIYNKKKVEVGGKVLEVGPGEFALTIEPTSPAVGGQLQGSNIDYDIDKGGLRFEVKSVTGAATMNLSKAGRKHNRNIKGMLWNLEKELDSFMEKFKTMSTFEKTAMSKVHHDGFDPNYIRWYLSQVDSEDYDADSITEQRKFWLQKIIDNIHKFNSRLPERMKLKHEWIQNPAAFKNFIESMDLTQTFKKTPGGLILVDRYNGWFLIPAKDVGEWIVPTGSARGDLVLALKKRPSGGVKATKHEKEQEREKSAAVKVAGDNKLRAELDAFNKFKATNGRNKEQRSAITTLHALKQRKANPGKDPMYTKFIGQIGTQESPEVLPTPTTAEQQPSGAKPNGEVERS